MKDSNDIAEVDNSNQVTALQFTSFENAKKQLQTFSTRNEGDFGISKVETDGGFLYLGNHKVTGTELNKITSQVQDYLIKINAFSKDVVKEIGHVYVALESLDKEYIPAIMTAVKGAEIASNQAKTASEHARVAQEDIKDTIQKQKRIVGVLEKHKEKLDKLKHLDNIDEIWKESKELEKSMSDFQKKFAEAKAQLSNFEKSIKSLQSFANSILDYEHLEEIDDMWERLNSTGEQLDSVLSQISSLDEAIDSILHIAHINDLDSIWNELENKKNEVVSLNENISLQKKELDSVKSEIQTLLRFKQTLEMQQHILDVDKSWTDLQIAKENINETNTRIQENKKLIESLGIENKEQSEMIQELKIVLEQSKLRYEEDSKVFRKRLTLAYIVSGGAVFMTVLQLVLNIIGVM